MKKVLLAALVGLIAVSASAATLQVTHSPSGTGQFSTFADAIAAAVDGDTIEIIDNSAPYDDAIINLDTGKTLTFRGTTTPFPIIQSKNLKKNDPRDPAMCTMVANSSMITVENIKFIANNPISDMNTENGNQYPFDLRHGPATFKNCILESPEKTENTIISHNQDILFEDCALEFGGNLWQLWANQTTFRRCAITTNAHPDSQNQALAIAFGGHVIFDNCTIDYSHTNAVSFQIENGYIELLNETIMRQKGRNAGINIVNKSDDFYNPNGKTLLGFHMNKSVYAMYDFPAEDGNGILINNDPDVIMAKGWFVQVIIENSDLIGGIEGGAHATSAIISSNLVNDETTKTVQIRDSVLYNWGFGVGLVGADQAQDVALIEFERNALFANAISNVTPELYNTFFTASNKFFSFADYPLASTFVYTDAMDNDFRIYYKSEVAKMNPVPGSMGVSPTDVPEPPMQGWPIEAVQVSGTAPVIDGVINDAEWSRANPIDLRIETLNAKDPYKSNYTHRGNAYSDTLDTGTVTNDADCSAKIYFMWDKDALYVAASVKDDINVSKTNTNEFNGAGKVNAGDCFQLCLDYDYLRAASGTAEGQLERILIPSWGAKANKGSIPVTEDGTSEAVDPNYYQFWPVSVDRPNQLAGMTWEVKMDGANYTLEARIPWNAFKVYNEQYMAAPYAKPFPPAIGQACGILPIVDDHDNPGTIFMVTEYGSNGFPVEAPAAYSTMTFVKDGSAPSTNFADQWNVFE